MSDKKKYTLEQAKKIGAKLGIEWSKYDVEQFRSPEYPVDQYRCQQQYSINNPVSSQQSTDRY